MEGNSMQKEMKAILVGVSVTSNQAEFEYSMEELENLADACQITVVGQLTQNLKQINYTHYVGSGKIDELVQLIDETEATIVIFDDELSATQIRNLESSLDCEVVDRTMLILEIFARRAKTRESQLQVEVAHLQYMLPRLVGSRTDLGRQGGGAGFKNRGAGETRLELDRRKIEDKIAVLSKELDNLIEQRKIQRKQRQQNNIPVVSLVGYTNAGKSTIMNAMLDAFSDGNDKVVFEKDMLFATLETAVRRVTLDTNQTFLLTDTVGFIHKLPHHLVKAFRSTLEEVIAADVLIHVVDYSNPFHAEQIKLTNKILGDIGVKDIPVVYAYNKIDLADEISPENKENHIYLSAKKKEGIAELTELVRELAFNHYIHCELLIPYAEGQIVAYFNENANVLTENYEEAGTKLEVECHQADAEKYQQYVIG